jgi:Skp family chaperone for outer membrane proteins
MTIALSRKRRFPILRIFLSPRKVGLTERRGSCRSRLLWFTEKPHGRSDSPIGTGLPYEHLKEEENTVKRITWCVALAASAAMLSLTGQASAQGTRVAVVNIGTVFTKYDKAKAFKTEMEATLKPFKDEAEKIKKNVLAYQDALKNAKEPKDRDQYENALRILKRQLEDLDLEARKKIGTRQEQHLIQLYKEVATHIQAVANANGIHLVLGFGEPPDGDLYTFANINRKLTAMDMGAVAPLFHNPTLDISEVVVQSLNRSYTGGAAATPTGLQK